MMIAEGTWQHRYMVGNLGHEASWQRLGIEERRMGISRQLGTQRHNMQVAMVGAWLILVGFPRRRGFGGGCGLTSIATQGATRTARPAAPMCGGALRLPQRATAARVFRHRADLGRARTRPMHWLAAPSRRAAALPTAAAAATPLVAASNACAIDSLRFGLSGEGRLRGADEPTADFLHFQLSCIWQLWEGSAGEHHALLRYGLRARRTLRRTWYLTETVLIVPVMSIATASTMTGSRIAMAAAAAAVVQADGRIASPGAGHARNKPTLGRLAGASRAAARSASLHRDPAELSATGGEGGGWFTRGWLAGACSDSTLRGSRCDLRLAYYSAPAGCGGTPLPSSPCAHPRRRLGALARLKRDGGGSERVCVSLNICPPHRPARVGGWTRRAQASAGRRRSSSPIAPRAWSREDRIS
eukprot:353058-Chlamydomonas_euryale.AAC.6